MSIRIKDGIAVIISHHSSLHARRETVSVLEAVDGVNQVIDLGNVASLGGDIFRSNLQT